MSQDYFLKLDRFEGPLDLLLHLIKVHELDIFDINILVLAQQYLDYLRMVKFRNLNEASRFLEIASALCEIKSLGLLPNEENQVNSENALESSDEMNLAERLQEYDRFKQAGQFLASIPQLGRTVVSGSEGLRLASIYGSNESPLRGDPATLLILYEQMLSRLSSRKPSRVQSVKESITVEEVIESLQNYLQELKVVLFQKMYGQFKSRYEFVAHILAMLQMVRDTRIKIHQENLDGPIWLYSNEIDEKEARHFSTE